VRSQLDGTVAVVIQQVAFTSSAVKVEGHAVELFLVFTRFLAFVDVSRADGGVIVAGDVRAANDRLPLTVLFKVGCRFDIAW
jgi:hypothetical protein